MAFVGNDALSEEVLAKLTVPEVKRFISTEIFWMSVLSGLLVMTIGNVAIAYGQRRRR